MRHEKFIKDVNRRAAKAIRAQETNTLYRYTFLEEEETESTGTPSGQHMRDSVPSQEKQVEGEGSLEEIYEMWQSDYPHLSVQLKRPGTRFGFSQFDPYELGLSFSEFSDIVLGRAFKEPRPAGV
jgi:hypothetical protein